MDEATKILLTEIKEDVKEIKTDTKKGFEKVDRGFEKFNGRVRKLETWKAYMIGIGSVLVVGIPIVIRVIWR